MSDTLITKYRPQTFDDVVGQDAAVRALRASVAKRSARAYLLTGPSGTGKTTLARIVAAELGCAPADLEEIDAATHTGVDDMRAVTAQQQYRPLGGGVRALVIDECHMLSKSAWNSLLKILEEPPAHVAWFLCTTEPTKVPKTVVTRCLACELRPVASSVLEELLGGVADAEKMDADGQVLRLCARQADGSPRQALSNLAVCAAAKSAQEARELMRSAEESAEAVDLARLLVKRGRWSEAQELIGRLSEVSPESVRHVVRAYVSKVVMSAKSEDQAGYGLEVLDAFSEPFHPSDGVAPLLLACGRLLLMRED